MKMKKKKENRDYPVIFAFCRILGLVRFVSFIGMYFYGLLGGVGRFLGRSHLRMDWHGTHDGQSMRGQWAMECRRGFQSGLGVWSFFSGTNFISFFRDSCELDG